jgi:hypothetical protein
MSASLDDLANAAADVVSAEKDNSSLLEDEDGFDAGPDPDYSKHCFVWFHEKAELYQTSKGVCAACIHCSFKDLDGGVPTTPPATSRCCMCGFAAHSSCLILFDPPLIEQGRELCVCKLCENRDNFNTVSHRRSKKIVNDEQAKELMSEMYCYKYALELVSSTTFKSMCDEIDDGLFDESSQNGKLHMIGCSVFMYPISNNCIVILLLQKKRMTTLQMMPLRTQTIQRKKKQRKKKQKKHRKIATTTMINGWILLNKSWMEWT